MFKRAGFLLLALMISAFLAGCGGAGGLISAITRSKPELLSWVMAGFNSHSANAGIESFIGRFGGRSQISGTREAGAPYFDQFLGVWVVDSSTANSYTATYSLDEAGTQPAGSSESTWVTTESGSSGSTKVRITAGPNEGYTLDSTYTSDDLLGTGSYSSSSFSPLYGTSQDEGEWKADGSGSYLSRWTQGTVFREYQGSWNADGSWTSRSTSSDGYTMTLNGIADGSGTGSITGPDPLLPATAVWNTEGAGTITWADGSTSEINWFGLGGVSGGSAGNPGDGDAGDGDSGGGAE